MIRHRIANRDGSQLRAPLGETMLPALSFSGVQIMALVARAAVAALVVSLSGLPAYGACVNPDNAGCLSTIQAGVNAAAVGEVVQVASGLYNEEVTIATQGLILRGRGVVIDPSGQAPPAHGITISANDVVIEGIAIRNGDDNGIQVTAAGGVQLLGVDVQSADDLCVSLTGATPNVSIESSHFRSCGDEAVASEDSSGLQLLGNSFEGADGVDVTGDGIRAERNTFTRGGGLAIDGADAVVTGNRFTHCSSGIEIVGSDPSVTRNSLTNTGGTAIDVEGDDLVVEGNPINGATGTGIHVFCDASCGSARVFRNRVTAIGGAGIDADSSDNGLRVEANQVSQVRGNGLNLDTLGASVLKNRVTGAGGAGGECLDVAGDSNTLTGNSLAGCGGDGIKVDGDNNAVEANRVSGTGDDGIDIVNAGLSNDVVRNQARGATDNGIEISVDATSTVVVDNQASGLHADFCDGGTNTDTPDTPDETSGCGNIDD
jgi:hypothetical protein